MKPAPTEWPKRPTPIAHAVLGKRQRWRSKCKQYRIDRSLEFGKGPFLPQVKTKDDDDGERWELIGRNQTLAAAKRACDEYHKRNEIQWKNSAIFPPTAIGPRVLVIGSAS